MLVTFSFLFLLHPMLTFCRDCLWPSNPIHGLFVHDSSLHPVSATLLCSPGYAHYPRSVTICNSHGEWSPSPSTMSCEPAVALLTGGTSVKERNVEVLSSHGDCSRILPSIEDGQSSATGEDLMRRAHTVDYMDQQVILCGGDESDLKRSCIRMDWMQELTWKPHSETVKKREHHVSGVLSQGLYLLSGDPESDDETAISVEFNGGDGEGWKMADWGLSSASWRSCSVTLYSLDYFGKVVVLGGGSSKKVEAYNLLDGEVQEFPNMIYPRNSFGCVVTRMDNSDGILVAGGHWVEDGEDYHDDGSSEFLNMNTMTWTMVGSLSKPRSYLQLVVLEDKVMAVGGWGGWEDNQPLDIIEEFDEATKQWKITEDVILQARENFAITTLPKIAVCN